MMVGRRGEAPLVPPYKCSSFKKAVSLTANTPQWTSHIERG